MNIGKKVNNSISKHVYKSIWDASHELIKSTPYNSIVYTIQSLIKTPINESIWLSAYDGVCEDITL